MMTELIKPDKKFRVLEIGTGSGYQAAILAECVKEVDSIEVVPALGKKAENVLRDLGYKNIEVRIGDGYQGWSERAPYDAIILTAAPPREVPRPLLEQLKVGGRLVAPVGRSSRNWYASPGLNRLRAGGDHRRPVCPDDRQGTGKVATDDLGRRIDSRMTFFATPALEIRKMFDLVAVQSSLKEFGLDGWLFYDFRGANVLARRVLGLDQKPVGSRRFFYFVPAQGEPRKLVHRIETAALDGLPGEKSIYLRWQDLEAGVAGLLHGSRRVAMEYAPRVSNPYVSRVDAGTIELVRGCGVEVVSSGDLIQRFEATWDDAQWQMHKDAEKVTSAAYDVAFGLIASRVRGGGTIRETEVQSAIMDHFHSHGLTTYSPPIVGVGPTAATRITSRYRARTQRSGEMTWC